MDGFRWFEMSMFGRLWHVSTQFSKRPLKTLVVPHSSLPSMSSGILISLITVTVIFLQQEPKNLPPCWHHLYGPIAKKINPSHTAKRSSRGYSTPRQIRTLYATSEPPSAMGAAFQQKHQRANCR